MTARGAGVTTSIKAAGANPAVRASKAVGGAKYALGLFLMIHIALSIDRSTPSIVLEPIKHEYHLLDWQLGLLPLGFSLFFGLCGIPLGRWVDMGVRRNILALCVGVFSL